MKSIIFNEIKKILECDFTLENPKDKNLAHFATPLAFSLAKELKKSPMLIASDLASKFQNHDCFESVEAVNGYLNFRISKTFLNELANQALANPNDFSKGEKKQESFLLEYV
ncbi:TPA_asm: arginine--tRNA ligase, partial [Campylobacter jejuni]|nr:arginine--tRNA ligase [Campylobacter jejuni]